MCLVYDPNADHVHGRPPAEAATWLLDKISEAIGAPCPDPLEVIVTNWAADPFARGSYTHVPPGASFEDVELLGEPVSPRLLFAGEGTTWEEMTHAGGAALTGIREASMTPESVRTAAMAARQAARIPSCPGSTRLRVEFASAVQSSAARHATCS